MVQLQNAVGHREPDSAALALGRKVQIEDAVSDFIGYSHAMILNFKDGRPGIFGKPYRKLAAVRHCLCAVQYDVEHRLLEQIRVNPHAYRVSRQLAYDRNIPRFELSRGQHENAGDDIAEVLVFQLELDRTREVHQGL